MVTKKKTSKKKRLVRKIRSQQAYTRVKDLRTVFESGDIVVVKIDRGKGGRWRYARVGHSMSEATAWYTVMDHDRKLIKNMSGTFVLEDLHAGRVMHAGDNRAPAIQQIIADDAAREARHAHVRARALRWRHEMNKRLPDGNNALGSIAGRLGGGCQVPYPSPMGFDAMIVGAQYPMTTLPLSAVHDLCTASDQMKAIKVIADEQIMLLALLREELGDERYQQLVTEARTLVEEGA